MGKEKFVFKYLLGSILILVVGCGQSRTGVSSDVNNNDKNTPSPLVKEFSTAKYLLEVLAPLDQFDLKALANHLKKSEEPEELQKLKFRSGVMYYTMALETLKRLQGRGQQEFSQNDIEQSFDSFIESFDKVEGLIYYHREDHIPLKKKLDPLDVRPSNMKIYDKATFARTKNFNCFQFFNNFNSIITDTKLTMQQLIQMRNNSSYIGMDSFRGSLIEVASKDSFSDHASHWWKTGALNDKARREQNLLMYQARLDTLDVFLRANLIYSLNHAEGGGSLDGACISEPSEKGEWQTQITELSIKLEQFYNTYFGLQSVKSRGDTLVQVSKHAHDKIIWENWKLGSVEALFSLPLFAGFNVTANLLRRGAVAVSSRLSKSTGKKAIISSAATKTIKPSMFKSAGFKNIKTQYAKVENLNDFFDFSLSTGFSLLKVGGLGTLKFFINYGKDLKKFLSFKELDKLSFGRLLAVGWPVGAATMYLYMNAEEAVKDESAEQKYQPMLEDYSAQKDYPIIEEDLRVADTGSIIHPISAEEWVDFNIAVEEFLTSHTQSPKVYFKLMSLKYDFLDHVELQQIANLYDLFPTLKADIRRYGDINTAINYYLQLEQELSQELGIEESL